MNSTITFYIVRHGKTLMNTLERVQGWCDSPLTDEGVDVALDLGAGLRNIHFESVYVSDLRRTRQTAQLILKEQGQGDLAIVEMDAFRECCFGSFESGANAQMWKDASLYLGFKKPEKMSEAIFNKTISSKNVLDAISELDTMGIAEDFDALEGRAHKGLHQVAKIESKKGRNLNVLLVSHGMCITVMLQNLGGRELQKYHLQNAAVCKVTYQNGTFKVESMGDMSYIESGREIRK